MAFYDTIAEWISRNIQVKQFMAASFLISLFMLFAPHWAMHTIGLDDFAAGHRVLFGMGLVVSCGVLLVYAVQWAWGRYEAAASANQKVARLHQLTNDEKRVLSDYITSQNRIAHWMVFTGTVTLLISEGVLRDTGGEAAYGSRPIAIEEWAFQYLLKHPELLEVPPATQQNDIR